MNLEERKQLCRKAWENDYIIYKKTDLLKLEKVDDILIKNVRKYFYRSHPRVKALLIFIHKYDIRKKNKEDLKESDELDDRQSKGKQVSLFEKVGEQGFNYDLKELFEPNTDTINNTSEDITKTITETSIKNNKALENLNEKDLELMNDKCMIAPYLASSLVNLLELENKS